VIRAGRTKWDHKRDASYNALVRSATHRFQAKGYAATTVADIVAGTGYTPGAFYHLFANKADCFWHVSPRASVCAAIGPSWRRSTTRPSRHLSSSWSTSSRISPRHWMA